MLSRLNDRSFFENENLVRRTNRTEMMRYDKDSPIPCELGDSLLDQRLVDRIKSVKAELL